MKIVLELVPKTRFKSLSILEEQNVLIGICGKRNQVKMIPLEKLFDKSAKLTPQRNPRDFFQKLKETKNCSHYSMGIFFLLFSSSFPFFLFP